MSKPKSKKYYYLDRHYRCLDVEPCVKDHLRERLAVCLPLKRYEYLEQIEMRCSSKWRGDYLYQWKLCDEVDFAENLASRYRSWLRIHWRAIKVLQKYFKTELEHNEEDVLNVLLSLLPYLPWDVNSTGMPPDHQKYHFQWMCEVTSPEQRLLIDRFLNDFAKASCSTAKTMPVRFASSSVENTGLYEKNVAICLKISRAANSSQTIRFLFKRLLLQTPLIFWPAILYQGVSELFDDPILVDWFKATATVSCATDGIILECESYHIDGGYECMNLWKTLQRGLPFEKSKTYQKRRIRT